MILSRQDKDLIFSSTENAIPLGSASVRASGFILRQRTTAPQRSQRGTAPTEDGATLISDQSSVTPTA